LDAPSGLELVVEGFDSFSIVRDPSLTPKVMAPFNSFSFLI
jgi:hypothetical protein